MRISTPADRLATGLTISLVSVWLTIHAQVPQAVVDRDKQTAALAIEAAQRGPIVPIPLIGDNGRTFGVVYDQYLIGATIARTAIAAGQPIGVEAIVQDPRWQSRGTIVVAYPIDCDGRTNRPLAIRWRLGGPAPVTPSTIAGPMRGAEAASLLSGVGVPDDALVVSMRNAIVAGGGGVEIDYANAVCRGGATTESISLVLSPSATLSRGINGIRLPDALSTLPSPSTVRILLTLDTAGRPRFPQPSQGLSELVPAAIAALEGRTYPPTTINGVPMPLSYSVPFVFTADGAPGQAAPFAPAAPPSSNGLMVSSTTTTMRVPAPGTPPPPVPPAPPGQTTSQLARLAVEIARAADPTPIPLDAAGPAVHGVVFDSFLLGAVKARAAAQAGTPMDPTSPPSTLFENNLIAVAFPLSCGDRTVAPTDVQMARGGTQPGAVPSIGPVLTGSALADRLPGVRLPAGAVGRTFLNQSVSSNPEVRITYASAPCGQSDGTLALPIQWVRGQSLPHTSLAKLPASAGVPSPTTVQLRGLVDLDGAYRFPTIADGPAELATAAAVVASQWKFQPYRANGVAVPTVVIMSLTFTASGMPEPAPPIAGGPPGTPPPVAIGALPQILTSSTVGGRSTMDFTTVDAAGLSASTSLCEIATDSTYGLSAAGAIGTGGGPMNGPPRERQYLTALRGPAGQGLHIVRRGATMGPDQETILDVFEVSYPSLAKPLLLYLDEYHDGPLKAPQGLVCAAKVG